MIMNEIDIQCNVYNDQMIVVKIYRNRQQIGYAYLIKEGDIASLNDILIID